MAASDKSDDGTKGVDILGDNVDLATFSQILEMDEDDDDDKEFTVSIVTGFFAQAEETFQAMDKALGEKNLDEMSKLGHFLKGSSATLGLNKVKDSCEKLQQYGKKENLDGTSQPDEELCLSRITTTLKEVKTEYKAGEDALKKFLDIP